MAAITGLAEPELHHAYWTPRRDYDRGTHTGEQYWQAAGALAGIELTDSQVAELIDADTQLWLQPNPPMIAWAARLQAAGTRTGILSNLGDAIMHGMLARLPWLAAFDHRTWSHTLQLAKPEPEIYAHAIAGLRVEAGHILFVDDREDNIEGALLAGMQAVRYHDQAEFEQQLAARDLGRLWREGRD